MSASSRARSLFAALRASPDTRRRLVVLERDHQVVLEAVRAMQIQLTEFQQLRDLANGVQQTVDRMHQTLVDADPQLALEIVTAVRDDVRSLLIEVTEQLNARGLQLDDAVDPIAQG